jgi:Transposase
MKRKRLLKRADHWYPEEAEAGAVVTRLCRKHGMSSPVYYAGNAKFGDREVPDAERLRALEDENAKLKRLLAEAMLDNAGLKDLLSKNGNARCKALEAVAHLQTTLGMSERRKCAVVGADRSSIRYCLCRANDGDLRSRLRELKQRHRRFGYRRLRRKVRLCSGRHAILPSQISRNGPLRR